VRDESGMSLVELSVAMLVSIILLLTVSLTVSVFSGAEANVVKSADAASYTRIALLQLQSDIQSAVPVQPLSTVAAYNTQLKVTVQPSGGVITWQYNSSAGTLTRQVGTHTPQVILSNVTNPTSLPVFHYFDHCGNDLVSLASQATTPDPSAIANLATVVQITLAVAGLDTAPYGTTTSVNVMNRSPGATAC
jgi:hypothetical protein